MSRHAPNVMGVRTAKRLRGYVAALVLLGPCATQAQVPTPSPTPRPIACLVTGSSTNSFGMKGELLRRAPCVRMCEQGLVEWIHGLNVRVRGRTVRWMAWSCAAVLESRARQMSCWRRRWNAAARRTSVT